MYFVGDFFVSHEKFHQEFYRHVLEGASKEIENVIALCDRDKIKIKKKNVCENHDKLLCYFFFKINFIHERHTSVG